MSTSAEPPPAAWSLPEEAFAAALAGLDAMTPRRLWLLARSGTALRCGLAGADGRPPGERARRSSACPARRRRWPRRGSGRPQRIDVAALWDRCQSHGDAVSDRGAARLSADELADESTPAGGPVHAAARRAR